MTAPRCLQSFKAGCIATEIPPQLPLKYWKKKPHTWICCYDNRYEIEKCPQGNKGKANNFTLKKTPKNKQTNQPQAGKITESLSFK